MARQGFMIYHEDARMLQFASDETIAAVFRNLFSLSVCLDETGEIKDFSADSGMIQALYDAMAGKIVRDAAKYSDKVRDNTIKAKAAALVRDAKANGKSLSAEKERYLAERWYTEQQRPAKAQQMPADAQQMPANKTIAETEAETVAPTESETLTQPPSLSVAVAQAEAVTLPAELQSLVQDAERRGVKVNERVIAVLREEFEKGTAEEVIRKLKAEPNFIVRLKMLGRML